MPSTKQLQRQFQGIQDVRQPVRQKFHALLGHPDGTTIEDPETAGYVFVRIDGDNNRVRRALCREVLQRYNQPVIVAYSDELPNTLEVIKLDRDAFAPSSGGGSSWDGGAQLGAHAGQHALGGGDTVWIQTKQIVPLRTRPAIPASMRVFVESGAYQYQSGFNYWPGGYTSDMTAQVPGAGLQLYRVLYIDAVTNALAYANTATMVIDPYLADFETVLDLIPISCVPLAAIRLYNGQTTIVEADIYELRSLISSAPGTVTGISWPKVKTVAPTGADYTTIFSALAAATAGDIILVMPGTYTESLTVNGSITLQGLDQGMERIVLTFGSGIPVSVSTGSPRINNVRIESGGVFAAFNVMAGGDTIVLLSEIVSQATTVVQNGNAGSIDLEYCRISTTGTNAIEQGINDTMVLTDCAIVGHVIQTGAGSTLMINGGKITGNLTCAAGSTIALHNLPTITGTVTATGTITGAYRDANGIVKLIDGATAGNGKFFDALTDGLTGGFRAGATADVLWYRGAADSWYTPDSVRVGAVLTVANSVQVEAGYISSLVDGLTGGFTAGTATDVLWYRGASNTWQTPNNVIIGAALTANILNLTATSNQIVFQSAGVTGTLTWTPATSNKVITFPNATGTVALLSVANVFTAIQNIDMASAPYWYISVSATPKSYWGVATAANQFVTGSAANDVVFRAETANILLTADGGTTIAATINSSSNFGIGIAPSYRLDVYTAAAAYAAKVKNFNGTDAGGGLWIDTRWNTAANRPLRITSNNELTELLAVGGDGKIYAGGTAGLVSQVVVLAKITAGGANGSFTVTQGIVTAYTAPT